MMDEAARKGSGIDRVLEVWSRRKWLAILVFVIPFSAVLSGVLFLPSIYRSTATVLIEGQQLPEAFVRSTVTSAVDTRLQAITQEILSRSRLDEMITRFGLFRDLRRRVSLEEVIERMRKDIQLELKGVKPMEKDRATIAFSISFRGSDPVAVAQVTNTLASFYIEENLKVRERQAAGTAEFLRVQLDETKVRLDEQERRVSAFKRQHMGELPQQLDANLSTLARLNMQLRVNSDNLPRTMERREELIRQLAEMENLISVGGSVTGVDPLTRVQGELRVAQSRFTDAHPTVIRLKGELEELQRPLAETKGSGEKEQDEPVMIGNPAAHRLKQAVREVDAEIGALKAETGRLRKDLAAYQARVEKTPGREQEFQSLARDYDSTKDLYQSLLKRYDEARLAESMEQRQKGEQFRVLDPATASERPVAPDRMRLILMGLLLSLGLAVGVAMAMEQIDTSFHTVDDLRAFTTVPVLVSIPPVITKADQIRSRWRSKVVALSVAVGLVGVVALAYFVAKGNEQLAWLLIKTGA
jgi:polysaccharide chain length determinant protein (PEP-CTERM system associated)